MAAVKKKLTKSLIWLVWRSDGRVTRPHAFLVVDGQRTPESLCGVTPAHGRVVARADPTEDRCAACDKKLRAKGKGVKKPKLATDTVYVPRFRYEDWDK